MPNFIPGLELSGMFYREAVRPILDSEFPGLVHSAAVIDTGSEVLGFDTARSMDHNWGPRMTLFLSDADLDQHSGAIYETLRQWLPHEFRGYPTNYIGSVTEADKGIVHLHASDAGPVNHRVETRTLRRYLQDYLNFDGALDALEPEDWLTFSTQKLRTLTSGAVYHDGLGALEPMRQRLAYYPRDVWLYLLAAGWRRIDQEEPFVGRCGEVGDELGSAVIAARLVRDLMRLCFLMERQYAPYPKWFGTGFARLACATTLTPVFEQALRADSWQKREVHLSQAYHVAAEMHNKLGITEPLPTEVSPFFGRPYLVIHGGAFVDAIKAQITDEKVKRIASFTDIGGIDQYSDSTDLLSRAALRLRLKRLYTALQ